MLKIPFIYAVRMMCLVLALATTRAAAQPVPPAGGTQAAAATGLAVAVTPAVIGANGSYTLSVANADGSAYAGLLDYDMLYCPNRVASSACRVSHAGEPWNAVPVTAGSATVSIDNADGNGTALLDGLYVVRYRPRNSSGQYSNQIAFSVDRAARPVSENTLNNSGQYPAPVPVEGAYAVYADRAADGSLNGYSKIEIEHGACGSGGRVQRFTKTNAGAYWAASANANSNTLSTLRWCVGPSATSGTNFKASDFQSYTYDRTATNATSLRNTQYLTPSLGLLGRLGSLPSSTANAFLQLGGGPQGLPLLEQLQQRNARGLRTNASADPQSLFYTLVPTNLFPPVLSNTFVPVVDRIISYSPADKVLDTWHVDVRASGLGGLYEVRYVEWALYIENLTALPVRASTPSQSVGDWNLFHRWSVLEDWDWNADGTLNRITQQGNSHAFTLPSQTDLPLDCWTTPDGCVSPLTHRLDKIIAYQPTTQPLVASFIDNFGSDVPVLQGRANLPLRLHVRAADGTPYDGFVQLATSTGSPATWTDANGYPIYVHDGVVEVLPSAFGAAANTLMSFKLRQQTLNAAITVDKQLANTAQPTNETQPFSNEIFFVQSAS